jgi:Glu-tRNA(Gln) amidotransferase subunit E-like FAD-binding protein
MNEENMDYEKVGLKAGLEIHQQLDTHKLFCSCPSILRKDKPLFRVKRKLNPVVGESGEIDAAAKYEESKDKTFFYEVFDTNCLVELDEEPPHEINLEAVKIALHIALLLNCKIFPVAQIMRKTVIDGSNTSGFQRTVLIAHDGFVETSFGKVGIDWIMLEEDAARPSGEREDSSSEIENSKCWKLDRLGIPLVEIATGPHMHTPEQIKEAALKIGELLRACKVRRGIGTIRQDVNISIKGSERVEIKGFQDTRVMNLTVINEIKRQQECIEKKSCKREVRRANPDGTTMFIRPMPGSARMYPETDCQLLRISESLVDEAKKTLPKLASENKSFLEEFGLNEELIKLILKEHKLEDFKYLSKVIQNPQLIAKTLVIFPKEIASKEKKTMSQVEECLSLEVLEGVLAEVGKNISENDVKIVLQKLVVGGSFKEVISKEKIDLEGEISALIKEKPGLNPNAYMGLIMAKFKGRVNGKEVMDILKKFAVSDG